MIAEDDQAYPFIDEVPVCAYKAGSWPGSGVGALTTGQAAKLCNVKPDTILKWIKSGKVEAVRTLGGHFRVDPRAISHFLERSCSDSVKLTGTQPAPYRPLYCWEYLSDLGVVREACNQCIVFRSHSAWCFRLKSTDGGSSHARLFCAQSCDDCAYYRRIAGLATHVLLVSADEQITEDLAGQEEHGVLLHVARNSYEASAAMSNHHPSFAVVDQDSLGSETNMLLECLSCDSRVPALKVILSTRIPSLRLGSVLPGNVVRVIHKPFDIADIVAVIESFPVDKIAPDG